MNVLSSEIHNNHNADITKMSISGLMGKLVVVSPDNGILHTTKRNDS
jgi:hypothetical protein